MMTHSDVPAETLAASAVAVMADPVTDLTAAGVAIWLDDLSRARLATGSLADLVRDSHVVGVTTNPTIFQKAMSHSDCYDRQISDLAVRSVEVEEAARMITTFDVRWRLENDGLTTFQASWTALAETLQRKLNRGNCN
jgi:hypothetical protein